MPIGGGLAELWRRKACPLLHEALRPYHGLGINISRGNRTSVHRIHNEPLTNDVRRKKSPSIKVAVIVYIIADEPW